MTNPKPNYRIVGTDRFCSGYCPLQANNSFVNDCGYKAWPGDHCILGLLDQRDQYKKELDKMRRESCEWMSNTFPRFTKQQFAESNGWDCYTPPSGEKEE